MIETLKLSDKDCKIAISNIYIRKFFKYKKIRSISGKISQEKLNLQKQTNRKKKRKLYKQKYNIMN